MEQKIFNGSHVNYSFHFMIQNILFTSVLFIINRNLLIEFICMGLYMLPSFPVINKVVYVTIAELAYVIIG